MKLEIDYGKRREKSPNNWNLKIILLNNALFKVKDYK